MLFRDILAQDHLKKHLLHLATRQRIPHAQLFVGPEGCGTLPMALAFARYVLCQNEGLENEGGEPSCNIKCEHFTHPDLHFIFPNSGTSEVSSTDASSSKFIAQWRTFLKEQPYGNLFDWFKVLGIENKQGFMGKNDALEISKNLVLKSFEGGYKVAIFWMAEKMNTACANKLLKLIEEPPAKTLFILIAEDEEQVLPTIRSRCQVLHFKALPQQVIAEALQARGAEAQKALRIAHQSQGNFNKALDLLHSDSEDQVFEQWFVLWVRTAFRAKGNKQAINTLLQWSEEISKSGRETQKQFLGYCIELFRQALLINYKAPSLAFISFETENFELSKFAPFVHGGNIMGILKELEDAIYHIERNGNAKIIFTDLSIKLTRLLHQKA